jgi:hypothetical protein
LQQLAVVTEIDDRRGQASVLFNMCLALDQLGQTAGAIEHAKASLKILQQLASPYAGRVQVQLSEWTERNTREPAPTIYGAIHG